MKELKYICEVLNNSLKEANDKLYKAGGKMSAGDLDYIDKLTHAIKSVESTIAMKKASEDSYSYNDMSRGMSRNSYGENDGSYKRDSMGRYSREYSRDYSRDYSREYSNDGQNEDMFTELRRIMNMTPDEKTRQEIKKFISTNEK